MPSVAVSNSFDLGPDFEPVVLSAILHHDRFFEKCRGLIKPELFTGPSGDVIRFVEDYYTKYKQVPSVPVLVDSIRRSGFDGAGGAIGLLEDLPDVKEDSAYIRDRLTEWAKQRAVDDILADEEARLDVRSLATRIEQASRIGDELSLEHTTLDEDREDESLQGETVPSPWGWFNDRINGGPVKGDFALVITVINGGKTTALVNIAMHGVALGLHVVYLTFEDGEPKIKRRMLQWINGWTTEELLADITRARKRRDAFMRQSEGFVHVKQFNTRRSTVDDMMAFVRNVEDARERKVDMVVVDYADRFKPQGRYNEPRHGLREVYEDCKYAAISMGVMLWSASQAAKGKIGKDIVGIEDGSESTGKFESCDIAIGLGQTLEDQKRETTTLFTSKVRDGKKGEMTTLVADYARQRIYERGDERMNRK